MPKTEARNEKLDLRVTPSVKRALQTLFLHQLKDVRTTLK
jgi:hypothetical protein